MNALVIGGTSGLGLETAGQLKREGYKVIITGRHDPKFTGLTYKKFDLKAGIDLGKAVQAFVKKLPTIDVLIYAAGYYQEGRITDLKPKEIEDMIDVGGRGLVYFTKYLLEKQGRLPELITITSTSQWMPRKLEPVYNFAKAAAGHFSNSLAEDGRVAKVLVAGPAGMRTPFWDGIKRTDMSDMLEPKWVASQIMKARPGGYSYKYIRILRQPTRVEKVEER